MAHYHGRHRARDNQRSDSQGCDIQRRAARFDDTGPVRKRLAAVVCLALVTAFAGFLGVVPASAQQAAPSPVVPTAAFDPGNIISDAVFYNTASMTEPQIRQFILTQGEGCTGAFCLKNLRVTTPDRPADRYCVAYPGGTNEDAAAVLLRVSVACGINPQVMLVTLQKESALLTRTDVSASSYDAAWGWHCPDTGPGGSANCDPAYAGFFNQAYGMAKQWSRYRLDPEKYNYHAGQTVDILWNVAESGCGAAPVTIANQATAALYNYTPYQPNTASLAAYPGVGDACSSYGNRNFFALFAKYFSTVTIPISPYVSAALGGQTITAPNLAVAGALAAGFSALGLPYVWGGGGSGAGPNNGCARGGGQFNSCGTTIGFDCSGLTAFVLGKGGYQIPDNSGSQRSAGVSVSWAQALPGDVVGFPGHVAIYLGTFDGTRYILEASWVGTPIHIVPLTRTDVDDRLYRYWTGPEVGIPGIAGISTITNGLPTLPAENRSGSNWTELATPPAGPRRSSPGDVLPPPAIQAPRKTIVVQTSPTSAHATPAPRSSAPQTTPSAPTTTMPPPSPSTNPSPATPPTTKPSTSTASPTSASPTMASPTTASPTTASPTTASPTTATTPAPPSSSVSITPSSSSSVEPPVPSTIAEPPALDGPILPTATESGANPPTVQPAPAPAPAPTEPAPAKRVPATPHCR